MGCQPAALFSAGWQPGRVEHGRVEHGRRDLDHVMPLRADLVLGPDALQLVDVARAAVVRRDLLRPGGRSVAATAQPAA